MEKKGKWFSKQEGSAMREKTSNYESLWWVGEEKKASERREEGAQDSPKRKRR